MKVIADSWNHAGPKFGESPELGFDYRVFLQDEIWFLGGLFIELGAMTSNELLSALEGLFCAAEDHYNGMLRWYHSEYNYLLHNNEATGGAFLGFILDYQDVLTKTPHGWLRDSALCQKIQSLLEEAVIDS